MAYNIVGNKKEQNEIICKLPQNHYFNYKRYLKGKSGTEEVYLVKPEGGIDNV